MLLNYTDIKNIVKKNKAFKSKVDIIDGYEIYQATYFLANYSDFNKPVADKLYSAYDVRGITFIKNKNKWERNLMMSKFFNINQTIGWMYDDIKNKEIAYVQSKEDGSLVRFIKLPNGKVIAKTIFSLDNEQTKLANEIYNSQSNIKEFVDICFRKDIIPLFELVSPYNQVVLKYEKTSLKLLQIRRNNGEYVSKEYIKFVAMEFELEHAEFYDYTLDELIEKSYSEQNIEGWVITFEDGQKVKIKTKWYLSMHKLLLSVCKRENDIIASVLDGTIDDVISEINSEEILQKIFNIQSLITDEINTIAQIIYDMVTLEYEHCGSIKSFAIKWNKHHYFHYMIFMLNHNKVSLEESYNQAKLYIKNRTTGLLDAINYINELKEINNGKF